MQTFGSYSILWQRFPQLGYSVSEETTIPVCSEVNICCFHFLPLFLQWKRQLLNIHHLSPTYNFAALHHSLPQCLLSRLVSWAGELAYLAGLNLSSCSQYSE